MAVGVSWTLVVWFGYRFILKVDPYSHPLLSLGITHQQYCSPPLVSYPKTNHTAPSTNLALLTASKFPCSKIHYRCTLLPEWLRHISSTYIIYIYRFKEVIGLPANHCHSFKQAKRYAQGRKELKGTSTLSFYRQPFTQASRRCLPYACRTFRISRGKG